MRWDENTLTEQSICMVQILLLRMAVQAGARMEGCQMTSSHSHAKKAMETILIDVEVATFGISRPPS